MGDPTGGRGEVGGGGELCFPSTEEIEGEGEGTREDAADSWAAWASVRIIATAIASLADIGGGAGTSVKEEARGVTGLTPRVPSASEEGPGGTSPLSSPFPASALGAGVLPEGFPVIRGGVWIREGSVDCHVIDGLFLPRLMLMSPLARLRGLAGVEEAR